LIPPMASSSSPSKLLLKCHEIWSMPKIPRQNRHQRRKLSMTPDFLLSTNSYGQLCYLKCGVFLDIKVFLFNRLILQRFLFYQIIFWQ
jgi:hypothetical protein